MCASSSRALGYYEAINRKGLRIDTILMNLRSMMPNEKRQNDDILYDHLWDRNSKTVDSKIRSVVAMCWGWRNESKGAWGNFGGDGNISYLSWGGGHTHV